MDYEQGTNTADDEEPLILRFSRLTSMLLSNYNVYDKALDGRQGGSHV
jgi:hypothetical protein